MSERVLFVDDEPNVLDGIRRQLRNRLDLETATGAAAGLDLIESRGHLPSSSRTCACPR